MPVAQFRQRPRSFRETLRRILKTAVAPQRNYQGTLTTVQGSLGGTYEPFSRVPLPADRSAIVKAELVVGYKTDGSTKTIALHTGPQNAGTFNSTGRYDITAYVQGRTDVPGGAPTQMMLVQATGAPAAPNTTSSSPSASKEGPRP